MNSDLSEINKHILIYINDGQERSRRRKKRDANRLSFFLFFFLLCCVQQRDDELLERFYHWKRRRIFRSPLSERENERINMGRNMFVSHRMK